MIINVNNKEYNLANKDLIQIPVEYIGAATGYFFIKTAVDVCTQMQTNPLAKVTLKVGGRILAATFGIRVGAMAGEMVNILYSVKEDEANG